VIREKMLIFSFMGTKTTGQRTKMVVEKKRKGRLKLKRSQRLKRKKVVIKVRRIKSINREMKRLRRRLLQSSKMMKRRSLHLLRNPSQSSTSTLLSLKFLRSSQKQSFCGL
jgi:hypothetical protein